MLNKRSKIICLSTILILLLSILSLVDNQMITTDDVSFKSMGDINREIDSTEYDAGVFKYSNFSLKLSNEHGRYSDVDDRATG